MAAYVLNKSFAFRGWKRLPYAILNVETGETVFLTKNDFDALSLCNGRVDVDADLISQNCRDLIGRAAMEGFVKKCTCEVQLEPWQEYKLYPARYVKKVFWSITGRCNFRCKHCCLSAGETRYGELSAKQCMAIIEQIKECGIKQLAITGGEPLIRADFFDIVDRLLADGVTIKQVYSNGSLITPQLLDAFTERRCKPDFHMSFDGVGWHDWLRGVDGAERAVLDAFKLCHDRGFSTGASMTIHRRNMHTLRDSVNLLGSLGVNSLKTNPVANTGSWLLNGGHNSLTTSEIHQVYLDYVPAFFNDGSPLTVMLGGFFKARKGSREYSIPAIRHSGKCEAERDCVCGHARANLYIDPDGRALPCMPMAGIDNVSEGFPLIQDRGLAACLTDSAYMRFTDMRLSALLEHNEECVSCEYRYYCGGGCRAAALEGGKTDLLGIDRAICGFFKEMWPERILQKITHEVKGVIKHPQWSFGAHVSSD